MSRSYQKRKSIRVRDNDNATFLNETTVYSKHKPRSGIKNKINLMIEQNTDEMECLSDSSNDYRIMEGTDLNYDIASDNELSDDDSDNNDENSVSDYEVLDYENDNEIDDNLQPIQGCLLFQYSSLTQYEVCSLLLAFKNKHTLSDKCFIRLLKLIKYILPFNNKLPTTLESIKKITSVARSKIELKKYCPNDNCQAIVQEATCVESLCKNFNRIIQPDLFHYVSIKQQLVTFIQRYHKDISKYLGGNKTFLDIVETSHYRRANTVDSNIINMIIYTDGIKLNDSDKECWPVFLSICELPLSLRDSKYNKIIAGK